jgi:hypothetical protein
MERLTKEQLKAKREAVTEEVEVAGMGTVLVRGLTRKEVLDGQRNRNGTAAIERYMLSKGVVDPQLTEDDVAEIQAVSLAGELEAATSKIQELSKIDSAKAAKELYKSIRDESGE